MAGPRNLTKYSFRPNTPVLDIVRHCLDLGAAQSPTGILTGFLTPRDGQGKHSVDDMNIARVILRVECNNRRRTPSSLMEGVVALLQPFRESVMEGVHGSMVEDTDSVN